MAKSVRVHDETHRALMALKERRRSASLDAVIRDMIKESTGIPVERIEPTSRPGKLTTYIAD